MAGDAQGVAGTSSHNGWQWEEGAGRAVGEDVRTHAQSGRHSTTASQRSTVEVRQDDTASDATPGPRPARVRALPAALRARSAGAMPTAAGTSTMPAGGGRWLPASLDSRSAGVCVPRART